MTFSLKVDQFGFPLIEAARRSKLDIWVDENCHELEAGLQDAGFKARKVDKGKKDEEIFKELDGDVLITRNAKDFVNDAVRCDYDIIDIQAIQFMDTKPDRTNKTVTKIAAAIRSSGIAHLKGNWKLTLQDDGSFTMSELV